MNNEFPNLGRELSSSTRTVSDNTKYDLDTEIKKLVKFAYESSLHLIHENREWFENIVEILIDERTISGKEIMYLKLEDTNKE